MKEYVLREKKASSIIAKKEIIFLFIIVVF